MADNRSETKKIAVFPLFNLKVKEDFSTNIRSGFRFSNNVLLRKISPEDIKKFRSFHPSLWKDSLYLVQKIDKETFVFEIEGDEKLIQKLPYEVLTAMRLYKNESVFYKVLIIEENTKIVFFGSINPPPPWKPSTFELNYEDLESLDKWVNKINNLNLENNSSFRVACDRFNRFYEERRDDDKIVDLAIAFEALFTGDVKEHLKNMGIIVGLACSMLLGKSEADRKEIMAFLKILFDLRNDIVHSNELKSKIIINGKKYKKIEFSKKLQEYLRDSIKKLS